MARREQWVFSPGEKLDIGKSLADGLDPGETLTGSPTVTVWQKTSTNPVTYADVTSSGGFVVEAAQVNTVQRLDELGGLIYDIGKGVECRLTAGPAIGEYEVRMECAGSDGSLPIAVGRLVVRGP